MQRERPIVASNPRLADTMRLMMPSAPVALLLQAALLEGDTVDKAWSQWRRTITDPKAFLASDRVGIKRHLPLLYRNLTTCRVDVGRDLEPYFRAARAREELRSVRYRRFLGEALGALQTSGVEFVVGKGVTVGETIHADPVLRHSHDIDLLVRSADIPAAAGALQQAGFLPSVERGPHGEQRFNHGSGLPVELHDSLFRTPFYDGNLTSLWSRARAGEIVGMPVRVIGDIDLLVHTLVHASLVPQRRGLSWITDVVTLLRRRESQAAAIDWKMVTQLAGEARATLPMYVTCQYLVTTFDAPIPPAVIDDLCRSAFIAGPLQHLAVLDGLRCDARGRRISSLLEASGWRSRATIARTMVLPPLAYFRARHPKSPAFALASLYFTRPLRFLAGQLRRLSYRLPRRSIHSTPPGYSLEPEHTGALT